jgi:hypothetical protein
VHVAFGGHHDHLPSLKWPHENVVKHAAELAGKKQIQCLIGARDLVPNSVSGINQV